MPELLRDRMAALAFVGAIVGAFVGFLARPAAPLIGQLPLGVVLTRGVYLTGFDKTLVPLAESSFNTMVLGAVVGLVSGVVLGRAFFPTVIAGEPWYPLSQGETRLTAIAVKRLFNRKEIRGQLDITNLRLLFRSTKALEADSVEVFSRDIVDVQQTDSWGSPYAIRIHTVTGQEYEFLAQAADRLASLVRQLVAT